MAVLLLTLKVMHHYYHLRMDTGGVGPRDSRLQEGCHLAQSGTGLQAQEEKGGQTTATHDNMNTVNTRIVFLSHMGVFMDLDSS